MFARIFLHFSSSLSSHYSNSSVTHTHTHKKQTHTQLFVLNWIFVQKKEKKNNNFCKIVMFMLYEIFIWNCFAKLLYFCMNVFFIGIIRNSYLTLASLPFVSFVWFTSVELRYRESFFFWFLGLWEVFLFIYLFFCGSLGMNGCASAAPCPPVMWMRLD